MKDKAIILGGPMHIDAAKPLELGLVVDKSGSMQSVKDVVINGFNSLIAEQSGAKISTLFFSTSTLMLHSGSAVNEVVPINRANYQPMGGTALLDGIGNMIDRIGRRIGYMDTKPRVIVAILTDGSENSSHEVHI